jgi:hypothetical protein
LRVALFGATIELVEIPIEDRDVTTIVAILGDIQHDARIRRLLEDEMAKRKRKLPKVTAEEIAERELHRQWLRERIAYHEAKAREEDERGAAKD